MYVLDLEELCWTEHSALANERRSHASQKVLVGTMLTLAWLECSVIRLTRCHF